MTRPVPDPDTTNLLGIDIGGTKCTVLIGTAGGIVFDRLTWQSDVSRGPEAMLADIATRTALIRQRNATPIRAVGVAVGGPLDADEGVVLGPPNLPGWDRVPLRSWLYDRLGLPVRVEHDAVACALAERHWGSARGAGTVAYLTCGTGFGLGLVINGEPYYGSGGHSTEIGHARFADDGPTAFGKAGSVEAFCAGASLPKLAAWRFPDRWRNEPPQGPALADLARSGDADAQAVIDGWADSVGRVAAGLADTLFPEVVVLGSLARYLGPQTMSRVHNTFKKETHPHATQRCRLVPAALGEELQDCSTLAAARRATG